MKALLSKFRRRPTSQSILEELRRGGAVIGTDVHIYAPSHTRIDNTCPWLLTIGDHVRITEGVKILTHDYAWSVLKHHPSDPGGIYGAQSPVTIGNHVFIGVNSVITRGVTIGSHVIIGAGSVVTKDCPDGGVYAGNPAKYLMSVEEYLQKRKQAQFAEAKQMALCYYRRFGKLPPREVFAEYFMLFATRQEAEAVPAFRKKMQLLDNYEQTAAYMDRHQPAFAGYEAFLQACGLTGKE